MEIRVLRYFLTIVEEKSINKAAGVLHYYTADAEPADRPAGR